MSMTPKKSASASAGKQHLSESNLKEESAFEDLLVADDVLDEHTDEADGSIGRDDVRAAMSKIRGTLSDAIRDERDRE